MINIGAAVAVEAAAVAVDGHQTSRVSTLHQLAISCSSTYGFRGNHILGSLIFFNGFTEGTA